VGHARGERDRGQEAARRPSGWHGARGGHERHGERRQRGGPVEEREGPRGGATQEEAEAHARRLGLAYKVQPPHERTIKPKAYADNFRYDRVRG